MKPVLFDTGWLQTGKKSSKKLFQDNVVPCERAPERLLQAADAFVEIQPGDYLAASRVRIFVLSGENQEVRRFSGLVETLLAIELFLGGSSAGICCRDTLPSGLNAL